MSETTEQFADVDADEAIRLATEQAYGEEKTIHSFSVGVPGLMMGADWDLEDVIDAIRNSQEMKWIQHPLAHNLAVKTADGLFMLFEVKRDA